MVGWVLGCSLVRLSTHYPEIEGSRENIEKSFNGKSILLKKCFQEVRKMYREYQPWDGIHQTLYEKNTVEVS
jgi:hypothetical protein